MVSNKRYAVADMADIFDNVRSYTIGFDRMFDNLNTVSELSNNYPPYNILKLDDEHFVIEIACAGFTKDEFNIHVVPEGNKLVIQGVQDRGEDKRDYYHKGIAARNFTRTFALTDDVEVTDADFENGMLNVSLVRIVPEEKKPKEIKVG
jgi:molecular chaperone IbpA